MNCAQCGKPTNIITQTNIPLCDEHFDDYLREHHGVRVKAGCAGEKKK